jgi:hypothetical protein
MKDGKTLRFLLWTVAALLVSALVVAPAVAGWDADFAAALGGLFILALFGLFHYALWGRLFSEQISRDRKWEAIQQDIDTGKWEASKKNRGEATP